MPSRPIEVHHKDHSRQKPSQSHAPSTHYGSAEKSGTSTSILLRIPSESLTHITSFLAPASLLSLARTNKQLQDHVNDDNTWRRAFALQFLGISPESDLRDDPHGKTLMLRRQETSWKKEFVVRYNLRRRWERSRNTTITHVPLHSSISAMHLMPSTTILAASLHYGVVSRSYPLTGKVLRGYLDASGTLNGLGIGNPNAEFSPNVTSVALTSEGGTAKVLWGFRSGDVAVTVATRTMDNSRASAAKLTRCKVEDCHEGMVTDVAWGSTPDGPMAFVTGGADGRVKLWDAKRIKCIWTSPRPSAPVPDACIKVAIDMVHGAVVGGFRTGAIVVWTGFSPVLAEGEVKSSALVPHEICIAPPEELSKPSAPYSGTPDRELSELLLHPGADDQLVVLAAYKNSPLVYCHVIDIALGTVRRVSLGDISSPAVTALHPVFATNPGETTFVLTGDQLGCISVFALDMLAVGDNKMVAPIRRLEAHEDGAVTAIAWNAVVLVSGSARGTVKVWDSLTFAPVRAFTSPAARPSTGGEWDSVGQVLSEPDAVVVSVGSRVMAWKAGPVGHRDKAAGKVKKSRSANASGVAKWHRQVEMYRDIAESRKELEIEQTHVRRAFGREKEQRSTLDHLGLSEVEAVEYVLMLSRDEEENRRQRSAAAASTSYMRAAGGDDELFFGDLDDLQPPTSNPSPPSSPSSLRVRPAPPSTSNNKVQVSPRLRPEPMEAGFSPGGSLSSSFGALNSMAPTPLTGAHFPAITSGRSTPAEPASPGSSFVSVSGSPESVRSAWSTPLRATRSMSSVLSAPLGAGLPSPPVAGPSLLSAELANQMRSVTVSEEHEHGEDEDEDLRFAIELSLAEARSRGEVV